MRSMPDEGALPVDSVILGIDAQTRVIGFALVELNGAPVLADHVMMSGEGALEHQIADVLDRVIATAAPYTVRAVVVERVGGGRGVQSMLAVANAAGITAGILACHYPAATMFRPTPGVWKKAAGLPGNATKDALRNAARLWAPELDTDDMRQDAVDALGIAISEARTINAAMGAENDATGSDLRASEGPGNGAAPLWTEGP